MVKGSAYNAGDLGSISGLGRSPRRKWQPTPVLLPGKSHGRRSLVGYSPGGPKESDTTERLHFHSEAFAASVASISKGIPVVCVWELFTVKISR